MLVISTQLVFPSRTILSTMRGFIVSSFPDSPHIPSSLTSTITCLIALSQHTFTDNSRILSNVTFYDGNATEHGASLFSTQAPWIQHNFPHYYHCLNSDANTDPQIGPSIKVSFSIPTVPEGSSPWSLQRRTAARDSRQRDICIMERSLRAVSYLRSISLSHHSRPRS